MKLWAISDLHLASSINRAALAALPNYGEDWLIVAGDVAERSEHVHLGLSDADGTVRASDLDSR